MTITKETTIGEVLRDDADKAAIFLEFGMHCLGCPVSQRESIEQASQVHGVDVDLLVEKLNQA